MARQSLPAGTVIGTMFFSLNGAGWSEAVIVGESGDLEAGLAALVLIKADRLALSPKQVKIDYLRCHPVGAKGAARSITPANDVNHGTYKSSDETVFTLPAVNKLLIRMSAEGGSKETSHFLGGVPANNLLVDDSFDVTETAWAANYSTWQTTMQDKSFISYFDPVTSTTQVIAPANFDMRGLRRRKTGRVFSPLAGRSAANH